MGPRTPLWGTPNLNLDEGCPVKSSPGQETNTSSAHNLFHSSAPDFLSTINSAAKWTQEREATPHHPHPHPLKEDPEQIEKSPQQQQQEQEQQEQKEEGSQNTFSLERWKKSSLISTPIIQKMCKSVVRVSGDETPAGVFCTSALSTPSSSSECDIAYRPNPLPSQPPRSPKNKTKPKQNKKINKQWKQNSGLLQVYVPHLFFHLQ